MKQALVLLMIIMTLFSFTLEGGISCNPTEKIICHETNINTCQCAPKSAGGSFKVSHSCNAPQRPICQGDSRTVNCRCS